MLPLPSPCTSDGAAKDGEPTEVELPKYLFFDLDNTLYHDNNRIGDSIGLAMDNYCVEKLRLSTGTGQIYYKKYGTTLCGLIKENILADEEAIDAFLHTIHDVNLDHIQEDRVLQKMLQVS